ncbi:MAG: NAD(P)-binding domain-containing protein [Kovacikia sp.]
MLNSIPHPAKADTIPVAVAESEVVILATPWEAAQEAISMTGDLGGKVLIDTMNPIGLNPEGLSRGLVIGHTTSAAEEVAKWATGARIVKAFNNRMSQE